MAHMFNICFGLIIAIISVSASAESITNEVASTEKVYPCQEKDVLLNVCKDKYAIFKGCGKKFFNVIFNDKPDVNYVGFHCCKELVIKQGRVCHDKFIQELTKDMPYKQGAPIYLAKSAKAWDACARAVILD
ncbi:hypothetical protein ACFE04_015052 [Oxalis oulophora]